MTYFVMHFDKKHSQGTWREFETLQSAQAELRAREANLPDDEEIVLLMAKDLKSLKVTHSRYFHRFGLDEGNLAESLFGTPASR